MSTLPVGVLIFISAPTLLEVWLGPVLERSPELLSQLPCYPSARTSDDDSGSSDGWLRVFYGLDWLNATHGW